MRATALLVVLAVVAVVPAVVYSQSCPFSSTAQGLSAYYGIINSSWFGPGTYSAAEKYSVVSALDGVLTSGNPYLNVNGTQGIFWSNVYRSNNGATPSACTCTSLTSNPCKPPFTETNGVCNTVPGVSYVDYTYWYVSMIGTLTPPVTGVYTFTVSADDGVNLWVDGVQVAHQSGTITPMIYPPQCNSNTISLTAGVPVCIFFNYYQAYGPSGLVVRWTAVNPSNASDVVLPNQLVPTNVFTPCGQNGPTCGIYQSLIAEDCTSGATVGSLFTTFTDTSGSEIKTFTTSGASFSVAANTGPIAGISAAFSATFAGYLSTYIPYVNNLDYSFNSILLSNMYNMQLSVTNANVKLYIGGVLVLSADSPTPTTTAVPTPLALLETPEGSGYSIIVEYTRISASAASSFNIQWQPAYTHQDTGYYVYSLVCPTYNQTSPSFVANPFNPTYTPYVNIPLNAFVGCVTPTPTATPTPQCAQIISLTPPTSVRYRYELAISGIFPSATSVQCVFDGGFLGVHTVNGTYNSSSLVTCAATYGIYGSANLSVTLDGLPGCNQVPIEILGPFDLIVYTGAALDANVDTTATVSDVYDCLAYDDSAGAGALTGYTVSTSSGTYCCHTKGLVNGGLCYPPSCALTGNPADFAIFSTVTTSDCWMKCYAEFQAVDPTVDVTASELQYISYKVDTEVFGTPPTGTTTPAVLTERHCWVLTPLDVLATAFVVEVDSEYYCCGTKGYLEAGVCYFGCPDHETSETTNFISTNDATVCYYRCWGVTEYPGNPNNP